MCHHGLSKATIGWLLEGDASIRYQVRRDLLGEDPAGLETLQRRIATEGWGARFLSLQRPDGHWGRGYYQPKWISTHYTLLDIRNLEPPRDLPTVRSIIEKTLTEVIGPDGGIGFSPTFLRANRPTDVCINGMFLNVAAYFRVTGQRLRELADLLLASRLGPALEILARKHRADATWPVQNRHPGAVHFDMEATGGPSRWNTLRAARVLAAYPNPAT